MRRISVRTHKYFFVFKVLKVFHEADCVKFVSSAYVSANDENGEMILHTAPSSPLPKAPALPPKQGLSQSHKPLADRDRN